MADEKKRIKLEAISIPSPCPMLWENLEGGDRERFCRDCEKHVHDLSAMTRVEAEQLLTENDGAICVSYEQAADGSVKTRDYVEVYRCPREAVQGAISLVAGALVAVWSNLPAFAKDTFVPSRTMGKIAAPINNSSGSSAPAGGSSTAGGANANNAGHSSGHAPAPKDASAPEPPRVGGAPAVRTTGEAVMRTTGMVPPPPPLNEKVIALKQLVLRDQIPGSVRGILVGPDLTVKIVAAPSASNAASWEKWQETVAANLFKAWQQRNHTGGQITLRLSVTDDRAISIVKQGIPHVSPPVISDNGSSAGGGQAFMAEVESTIASLKQDSSWRFPKNSGPVQQVIFSVTLSADKEHFPRQQIDTL